MIQVFLFHIDLFDFNGCYGYRKWPPIKAKVEKMSFWAKIWRFNRTVNIEHKQIPKRYLNIHMEKS